MPSREEYDVVSCVNLELSIEARFVSKGFMISLIVLVYNIGHLRFLRGLNGLRGSLGGGNDDGYSEHPHKKLFFFLSFTSSILICKYPPVQMNSPL